MFGVIVWDANGRNVHGPLSNLVSASMLFREYAAPAINENKNGASGAVGDHGAGNRETNQSGNGNTGQGTEEPKRPDNNGNGNTGQGNGEPKGPDNKIGQNSGEDSGNPNGNIEGEDPSITPIAAPNPNTKSSVGVIIVVTIGSALVLVILIASVLLYIAQQQRRKFGRRHGHLEVPEIWRPRDPIARHQRLPFPLWVPRFFPGMRYNSPKDYLTDPFE